MKASSKTRQRTDKDRLAAGMKAVLGQPNEEDNRRYESLQEQVAKCERAANRATELVNAGVSGWSIVFDHNIGKHVINYHDGRREVVE
ncbi:MAG: hypothetical protein KDH93_19115 [Rhodoferax sp.]|nr:hypothetical protein [Rhodoferax sp.]MCB2007135.1 hypothetical protein [Rhodoferax sp.]MCB2027779.1 hypothetical protein [Rhodoferax sp.]MCP5262415.1 hypothetical protein [Rhodoferax sp.]